MSRVLIKSYSVFIMCFVMLLSVPSLAQEELSTEKLRELELYTSTLLEDLNEAQAQLIYDLRMHYGILRSVRVVQVDVANAVEACGEENADLKEEMSSRHQAWLGKIDPVLERARNDLDEAIKRQTVKPEEDIDVLFDKLEAAFEERDDQGLVKVPITTEDACRSLLANMDQTEENLLNLLDQTLGKLREQLDSADSQTTEAPVIEDPDMDDL